MQKTLKNYIYEISAGTVFLLCIFVLYFKCLTDPTNFLVGVPGDLFGALFLQEAFKHLLTEPNFTLIKSIYFPIGMDISGAWEGTFANYVGAMFGIILSPVAACNLCVVVIIILNWCVTSSIFYTLSSRSPLGLLIGASFCLAPYFLSRSLGHLNLLSYCHVPALLLIVFRPPNSPFTFRTSLLIAATLIVAGISSFYYLFASLLLLSLLGLILILEKKKRVSFWGDLFFLTAGVTFGIILCAAAVWPMVRAHVLGSVWFYPYPHRMTENDLINQLSLTWRDYIQPPGIGIFAKYTEWVNNDLEKQAYLGIPCILAAIISFIILLKKKQGVILFRIALLISSFFLLSFGSNSAIPVYSFLSNISPISLGHGPGRFSCIVMLLLWATVAYALSFVPKRKYWSLIGAIGLIQLIETLSYRIPYQDMRPVRILEFANDHSSSPILLLPIEEDTFRAALVPLFSQRPIFSGMFWHTTFTNQSTQIIFSNTLRHFLSKPAYDEDIFPFITPIISLDYLKAKYGVRDVVTNNINISTATEKLLREHFDLLAKSPQYSIWRRPDRFSESTSREISIHSSLGFFRPKSQVRPFGKSAFIDLYNPTSTTQSIVLKMKIAAALPNDEILVDKLSFLTNRALSLPPGITTLNLSTRSQQCKLIDVDCIGGYLLAISVHKG
jgi:hypothetical protein